LEMEPVKLGTPNYRTCLKAKNTTNITLNTWKQHNKYMPCLVWLARVNQHHHWWYLHLLGKDLLELIISQGNVKFGLKDLDLV
jgi:hypothetical protein